jgi:hypothetical protein
MDRGQLVKELLAEAREFTEEERGGFVELLDELAGEYLGDLFRTLVSESNQNDDSQAPVSAVIEATFESDFWQFVVNKIERDRCLSLYVQLPRGEGTFGRDFREGVERSAITDRWKQGKVHPFFWLKNKGWEDRPVGHDGKPLIGKSERSRLKAEADEKRAATPPVVRQAAEKVGSSMPAAESTFSDWYASFCAAGGAPIAQADAYLQHLAAGGEASITTERYFKHRAAGGPRNEIAEARLRDVVGSNKSSQTSGRKA